ncbi:hypothetical protein BH23THE1_BH23THE1_19430 [soil metagenome]
MSTNPINKFGFFMVLHLDKLIDGDDIFGIYMRTSGGINPDIVLL